MTAAPHLLNLRVLRAARPSLYLTDTPWAETSRAALERERDFVAPLETALNVTNVLSLPSSFGQLHLGEHFRSAIVLAHDGIANEVARHPTLTLEIDSPSKQKMLLSEMDDATMELKPGQCIEALADFEIKEPGAHALVCTVTYETAGDAEPRQFRKLFRFNVTNPLSVRTKVHGVTSAIGQLSPHRETSYLEVQISNTAQAPSLMHFERVDLDPAEGMSHTPASTDSTDPFSLDAGTVRQHLFILTPVHAAPSEMFAKAQGVGTLPLGRLDLNWRTRGGEPGRLQTSTLVRRLPTPLSPAPRLTSTARETDEATDQAPPTTKISSSECTLSILSCPRTTPPGRPFVVRVRVSGGARLESFRPPAPVTEQMASLLSAEQPIPDTQDALCLDCRRLADGDEWETRWMPIATAGEIIDVGGLRCVEGDDRQVVAEWPVICQVWLVQHAVL